ncbi:MAG: sensor histidine kinase [Candidatus Riflebacteria bacterium]|nr:sensor histidine kinase [Candidatus Riflebacteria bacterium]
MANIKEPERFENPFSDWETLYSRAMIQSFQTRRLAKNGRLMNTWHKITRLLRTRNIVPLVTAANDLSGPDQGLVAVAEMPQRIIMAQEKERTRISEEIHSDFGQSLILLKMFIVTAATTLDEVNPKVKLLLEEIKNQVTGIIKNARDLSHRLAPPSLKHLGLVQAIKKMIESTRHQDCPRIHFIHRYMGRVDFTTENIIIYRIVQEALNNIFKHAEATSVRIVAMARESTFSLTISDNGKGFSPSKINHSDGLGLDLMQEQVSLIHGSLRIESQIGKGTTIKVTIPINKQEKQKRS